MNKKHFHEAALKRHARRRLEEIAHERAIGRRGTQQHFESWIRHLERLERGMK